MEVAGNAIGLDLGKRTYEMCLITKSNKINRSGGTTDFSGLNKLCMKLSKDDVVAMEACNLAFRLWSAFSPPQRTGLWHWSRGG